MNNADSETQHTTFETEMEGSASRFGVVGGVWRSFVMQLVLAWIDD